MNKTKVIGSAILVLGVISVITSAYIKKGVAEGKEQISTAEKTVEQADSLFSHSRITKGVTESAHKKIDEGKEKIISYTTLAKRLQVGGWILIVAGVGLFILSRSKQGDLMHIKKRALTHAKKNNLIRSKKSK